MSCLFEVQSITALCHTVHGNIVLIVTNQVGCRRVVNNSVMVDTCEVKDALKICFHEGSFSTLVTPFTSLSYSILVADWILSKLCLYDHILYVFSLYMYDMV